LFYSQALKTKTGRHRDVFTSADLVDYYKTGRNPFAQNQYGQTKGTEVLIFSMGNVDMQMGLSFPIDKADADDRDVYEQPPELRIPLRPGTLLLYSPLDGLFFCHEVTSHESAPPPTGSSYSG